MRPADRHFRRAVLAWSAAGLLGLLLSHLPLAAIPAARGEEAGEGATEEPKNPYVGQPEALEERAATFELSGVR